jgi:hypothetical protein
MITKWLQYADSNHYTLNECSLAKDDIAEAFPQLRFSPESAPLMCTMIDEDLFAIDVNTNFGHTSLPMAFNFVSQRHLHRVRKLAHGVIDKYVDDYMLFSHDSEIARDQALNQDGIKQAFGDAAIEPDKNVQPCKAANIIGWFVDLTKESIRPNDKGIDKLLFVFFFVDEHQPQPLRVYQLMASLAERYSCALRGFRCFVDPIINMTRKWNSRNSFTKRKADSNARFAIEMWRTVAILLWISKDSFSVSLRLFATPKTYPHDTIIKTDAAPWQISAGILDEERRIHHHVKFPLPFVDPDNKFQNVKEFLGVILCLILVHTILKPTRLVRILWVGDNTSALKWAENSKCASRAAQYANIIFVWLQIYKPMQVISTEHCQGIHMGTSTP